MATPAPNVIVRVRRKRRYEAVEHLVMCNKRRKVDGGGREAVDALADDMADLGKAPHQRAGARVFQLIKTPATGAATGSGAPSTAAVAAPSEGAQPASSSPAPPPTRKRKRAEIDFSSATVEREDDTGAVVITFNGRDPVETAGARGHGSALKDAGSAGVTAGERDAKKVKWSDAAPDVAQTGQDAGDAGDAMDVDDEEGWVVDSYTLVNPKDVATLKFGEASLFADDSIDAAGVEVFDYDWDGLDDWILAIEAKQQVLFGREEDDDSNDEHHPRCDYPETAGHGFLSDSESDNVEEEEEQETSDGEGEYYDPYRPRARAARGEDAWAVDGGFDEGPYYGPGGSATAPTAGAAPPQARPPPDRPVDSDFGTGRHLAELVARMNNMSIHGLDDDGDSDGEAYFNANPHCDYDDEEDYPDDDDYGFV